VAIECRRQQENVRDRSSYTYQIILYDFQPNRDFLDRFSYKSAVSHFTDIGAVGVALVLASWWTDKGGHIL